MLNLSDKELDRLAREAASEYDPGDLAGPGSWDRLHLRLDIETGYPRLNLFRSIRRMSFYYAPAILLLAGASYFLFRPSRSQSPTHPPGSPATAKSEPSASPPGRGIDQNQPAPANSDRSIRNPNNNYSSTSTKTSSPSASGATTYSRAEQGTLPTRSARPGQSVIPSEQTVATGSASETTTQPATKPASESTTKENDALGQNGLSSSSPGTPGTGQAATANGSAQQGTASANKGTASANNSGDRQIASSNATGNLPAGTASGFSHNNGRLHHAGHGITAPGGTTANGGTSSVNENTASGNENTASGYGNTAPGSGNSDLASPSYSTVSGINPTRRPDPVIDDAPLRKLAPVLTAKTAEPVNPGKTPSHSLHIDRRLQIGVSLAPDFTSVNSLAGDKPGSDIGITASYQLFSRWHLQTGFLLSHRNYTAAQEDYHVPYDYYRMNNMHDVYFVKGNLSLFEIPLNLRYDFSISGNTSFFVSGGVSSYLLTHENCNYYFDLFGRTVYQEFKYDDHQKSLFGTVNLSMGVETGLTNSLSLLIAPFMKIPTAGLGFGNIEMNSFGVEFGLKYAPVLRRKRR
jgi:hypothetical protein